MIRLGTTFGLLLALSLVLLPLSSAEQSASSTLIAVDSNGYRIANYRAPTPTSVPHGITITTHELQELIRLQDPVLIDVQAVTVRPETEDFSMSWLPNRARFNLPGSVWLPNVGYGKLVERMDDYFRYHLARVTGGNRDRPIVIYCVVDCWMSWNAVQRAAGYGYRQLYWYREGTDGWAARGLPLVKAEPLPLH